MAVVVDPVLPLQCLDVPEIGFGVRARHAIAKRLERVQERLLETTAQAHALACGQVRQDGGQTALESDRNIDPLDFERRLPGRKPMAEREGVAIEVTNG